MEYVLSFAQNWEDIVLYHALREIEGESIFWIDIGANDPVFINVTKYFSIKGGCGINIEPQHVCIEKLMQDRPNDINLEIGVSNKNEVLTFHGSGTEASFDADDVHVKGKKTTQIEVRTLSSICEEYAGDRTIHFLKIDVEGWEKQCIEGMDFHRWRPWIVLVESYDPSTGKASYPEWEDVLKKENYDFVLDDGTNRYYVAKEQSEIASRVLSRSELSKIYDVTLFSDRYLYERLMRYQKLEHFMTRIKGSFLLTPVRKLYFKHKAKQRLNRINENQ